MKTRRYKRRKGGLTGPSAACFGLFSGGIVATPGPKKTFEFYSSGEGLRARRGRHALPFSAISPVPKLADFFLFFLRQKTWPKSCLPWHGRPKKPRLKRDVRARPLAPLSPSKTLGLRENSQALRQSAPPGSRGATGPGLVCLAGRGHN